MPEPVDSRVAVYIDFDNIIISRYAQVHPNFRRDQLRTFTDDPTMKARLDDATVDIGAILDYASSFGTIVISRAYADWSLPVNAAYQRQLISRAVDLTQMFPTSATKNGADIRLAVDVVEDLFRLDTITHVVIVAGDSDYISLAQRAKRLDRYVVGIGVAGSVSSSLADACSEFADYDDLPGVEKPRKRASARTEPTPVVEPVETAKTPPAKKAPANTAAPKVDRELQSLRDKAAVLLKRALDLGEGDADNWQHGSAVKNQMKRMDPKFNEKALEFSTFMDFVDSRPKLVEVKKDGQARMLRLH
jgi:uncharacterized LabA/DUF88 family protein